MCRHRWTTRLRIFLHGVLQVSTEHNIWSRRSCFKILLTRSHGVISQIVLYWEPCTTGYAPSRPTNMLMSIVCYNRRCQQRVLGCLTTVRKAQSFTIQTLNCKCLTSCKVLLVKISIMWLTLLSSLRANICTVYVYIGGGKRRGRHELLSSDLAVIRVCVLSSDTVRALGNVYYSESGGTQTGANTLIEKPKHVNICVTEWTDTEILIECLIWALSGGLKTTNLGEWCMNVIIHEAGR